MLILGPCNFQIRTRISRRQSVDFICQNRRLCLVLLVLITIGVLLMSSCVNTETSPPTANGNVEEARRVLADAEKQLLDLSIKSSRADWIKSTFITDDTEALAAQANNDLIAATTELAEKGRRFESLALSPEEK